MISIGCPGNSKYFRERFACALQTVCITWVKLNSNVLVIFGTTVSVEDAIYSNQMLVNEPSDKMNTLTVLLDCMMSGHRRN